MNLFIRFTNWNQPDRLTSQLKDYVGVTFGFFWQRQLIYFLALSISAYYFHPIIALLSYSFVILSEFIDILIALRIRKWNGDSPQKARRYLLFTIASTMLSSIAVCIFILSIAVQQGPGGHFTPLFFLFAASLFAAMNNHQIPIALVLRLAMYGASFFVIALLDIYPLNPPLKSPVWLEFFTTLFALGFIVSNSMVFFRLYQSLQSQVEKLKREHQRTKAAYEAKSQFVSTISHELRTPLTAINGALGLATSGGVGLLPDKVKSLFEVAERNSIRLSVLIDDLLDTQMLEANELTINLESLNLGEIIEESVDINKSIAETAGVQIKTELPVEEVWIKGDKSRLMQVLANLLSNAVKFSTEGDEVEVSLEITDNAVRMYVKDNGVGIPKNSKDQVFGYFSQVDSTDRRKVGGSGLGMYITKMIVERHNGKIDYSSELGKGTTFTVEFKRSRL